MKAMRINEPRFSGGALGVLLLCQFSASVFGQSTNATLAGTVADPSGAVIPSARVSATHAATGLVREVEANAVGAYRISPLEVHGSLYEFRRHEWARRQRALGQPRWARGGLRPPKPTTVGGPLRIPKVHEQRP